jgi:hypothetical protein
VNTNAFLLLAPVQHISAFVDWLIGQLKRPSNPSKSIPTATSVLALLLKERGTRQLFLRAGGVQLLAPLLKSSNSPSNSQLLYELCLCAWQMSFVHAAAEAMGKAGAAYTKRHLPLAARHVVACQYCTCLHGRQLSYLPEKRSSRQQWFSLTQ